MDVPKKTWRRLTCLPTWNFKPKQPYGYAWGTMVFIGLYIGAMIYVLTVSSNSTVDHFLLLLATFIWTTVIIVYLLLIQSATYYSKWLPLVLMPIYVVAFISTYSFTVRESSVLDAIETPVFLLAVLQASILMLLIHLLSYPLHPEGIEKVNNLSGFLPVYLDNWYKGIRALSAIIISYGVGIVVAYTLQGGVSATDEIINYNLITTAIPSILIIIYVAQKHLYIMSLIRRSYEKDS